MSKWTRSGKVTAAVVAVSVFASCGGQPWPGDSPEGAAPTTTPPVSTSITPGPTAPLARLNTLASCTRIIRSLSSPPTMRSDADFIALIRTLRLPSLPAAGFESVQPDLPLGRYPDIESYIRYTPLPSPSRTRELFQRDGYVVAEASGYTIGEDHYGAEGIQFRDAAGADHYNRSDMMDLCDQAAVMNLRRIPGVADGLSLVRTDGLSPYRAYLVIGDTVIHLNICSCVTVSDLQSLAERWALRVEQRSAG